MYHRERLSEKFESVNPKLTIGQLSGEVSS